MDLDEFTGLAVNFGKRVVEDGTQLNLLLLELETKKSKKPTIGVIALDVERGDFPAVVKALVASFDAVNAALIMEAWVAELDRDDPLQKEFLRRLESGEIAVHSLPPQYRHDQLVISSESRKGLKGTFS
jgi:hypothetical protein